MPADAAAVQAYRGLAEVTGYLPHPPWDLREAADRVASGAPTPTGSPSQCDGEVGWRWSATSS